MKIPDNVRNLWIERMSPDVDFFSRIENGTLVIRIYPLRKRTTEDETQQAQEHVS